MPNKEGAIQKQILDYLRLNGYVAFKFNNVGIFNKKTGSYIPSHSVGVSDILFCDRNGRFGAIEVKYGNNKPTDNQAMFLKQIADNNGIAILAYSLDDVIAQL